MTAYYVVAFSTLLLALFSRYVTHHFAAPRGAIATARSEKTWSFFDLPILAILISASALRATSVGTDTQVYEWIFSGIPENRTLTEALSESTQEVGYTALSYAIKVSGGEFPALLWVTSSITVLAAYWALKRTSKNFPLALAMFVMLGAYLIHFNALRQGMAISILFLASTFLASRRGWLTYALLAIFAVSVHSTAIVAAIMLPVFLKWRVSIKRLVLLALAVVAVTLSLWGSPWLSSLVESLNPRYLVYLDWKVEAGLGLFLLILVRLALLIYAISARPAPDDMKFAAWSALGVAWLVIGTQSLVVSRVSAYFLIFLCVLVPNAMKERKLSPFHTVGVVVCAAIFLGFNVSNFSDLVPYVTR